MRAAILQLTSRQLAALKFYAAVRIKILGRQARGRDHDDLLQEVIRSTISGERQWKMKVPFYVHLKASIRSISNAWSQKLAVDELPENGFNPDDGKPYLKATDASTASHTTINDQLDANAFLERLYKTFPVGTIERALIDYWEQGYAPSEIADELDLSETAYRAAVQRLRRSPAVRSIFRMRSSSHV